MKNSAQHARALTQLIKKLSRYSTSHAVDDLDPMGQFIHGFLVYDCSHAKSGPAYRKLMSHVLDYNDLRVSDPVEIAHVIGMKYPDVTERTTRMRRALHDIYLREHDVSLSKLHELPKKEVREYLDTLDGMVPYVSAAVTLLGFDGHAIPVDRQLYEKLHEDGVIDPEATFEETVAFLEYHILSSEAIEVHKRLRAYVERRIRFTPPKPKTKSPTKRSPRKKSTKKKSTKKKSTKKKTSRKKGTKKKSSRKPTKKRTKKKTKRGRGR